MLPCLTLGALASLRAQSRYFVVFEDDAVVRSESKPNSLRWLVKFTTGYNLSRLQYGRSP